MHVSVEPLAASPGVLALPAIDITHAPVRGRDEVVLGIARGLDPAHEIARNKLGGRHLADVLAVDVARDTRAEIVVLLVLVVDGAHTL